MSGKLTVVTGPMKSGKTTYLLSRVSSCIDGRPVLVYRPEIDTRNNSEYLCARGVHSSIKGKRIHLGGDEICMDLISTPEYEKKRTLVVIDDTQFFDLKILLSVLKLLENGVDILAVGLDMNSEGKPFGPMPFLMSIADEVIKLKAICEKCGKPATMTARKDKQKAHIDIGDEQYISVCRDCWIMCQRKESSSPLTTIAQPPLF